MNISKFWLLLGSVKPDYVQDKINHYKDESISLFYKKYRELKNVHSGSQNRLYSLKIGELFHYICDFFCYAHNSKLMKEKYKPHFLYEIRLNNFARKYEDKLFKNDLIGSFIYDIPFSRFIELQHEKYCKEKSDFRSDIITSFNLCIYTTYKLMFDTIAHEYIQEKEMVKQVAVN